MTEVEREQLRQEGREEVLREVYDLFRARLDAQTKETLLAICSKYGIVLEDIDDVIIDDNIMVLLNGRAFCCECCKANVFTKLRRGDKLIFRCHGCQLEYEGTEKGEKD